MLGNDIIDLQEVLASGQAARPGFRDRICCTGELQALEASFSEEECIWLLWAIKESAYKYYIQAGGTPLFAPKKFRFTPSKLEPDRISGYTQTPNGRVASQVQVSEAYLTAESWSTQFAQTRVHRKIFLLEARGQKDKSQRLKDLVCQQLAASIGEIPEAVSIRKDERQVPFLYRGQEKLPFAMSLSHHGAWGFVSYQQENSPSLG